MNAAERAGRGGRGMRRVARRILRVVLPLLLSAILLLIITLLALRLLLPHWDGLHERLEAGVSAAAGMEMQAETVDLGWRGWAPELVVREVRMAAAGADPLRVEEVGATLDPVASLRDRAPRLRLHVAGMQARLVREADGRVVFHGRSLGTGEGAVLEHAMENWPELDAEQLSLAWEDRVAGVTSAIALEHVHFRIGADGDGLLRLAGALDPETAGGFHLGVRIPASAVRDARFFLDGHDLELAHWAPWLAYLGLPVVDGEADAQVHGELADGRIRKLSGSHAARLHGDEGARDREIGHRFRWRVADDWHESSWVGTHPGSGDLRMRYRLEADAEGPRVNDVELVAREMDAGAYAPLKPLLERVAPELAPQLVRLRPRGRLAEGVLVAGREGEDLRIREAEGDLRSVSLQSDGDWPGIRGMDLLAWWDGDAGEAGARLDAQQVRVEFPRVLGDEILWLDALRGRLLARRHAPGDWSVNAEGLELQADQGGATLRGDLRLDGHDQGPLLAMAMDIHHADGAYAARYLPERYLPATTHDWLAHGIVDGRGTGGGMAYRGRPQAFPFTDHQGVFDLWADIEDGVLDYQEGWPLAEDLEGRLLFRNQAFRTEGARGRILDTRITRGDVEVTDMTGEPDLELDAATEGDAADLLTYLRQAGLGDEVADLRDASSASGPVGLDLQLLLPLSSERMDDLRVAGRLRPQDVALDVPQWPVALSGVAGEIAFDSIDRVQAEALEAGVHGEPVLLDLDWPLDGSAARLALRGPQPLGPWLEDLPELAAHARGRAHWDAELRLGGERDGMRLDLRSDLDGVTIDWPAPVGKAADESRDLELSLPLGNREPATGELILGDVLRADLRLQPEADDDDESPVLQALALGLGRAAAQPPELPAQGAQVAGHFAELDARAWGEALQDAPWAGNVQVAAPDADAPEEVTTGLPLNRLDLRVDEALRWDDLSVTGTRLEAVRDSGGWWLDSRSDWVEGRAGWRYGMTDRRDHLNLDLQRLELPWPETGDEPADDEAPLPPVEGVDDPRNWPSVRLTLDSLRLGDYRFAGIRGDLSPDPDGLELGELLVETPEPGVRARGDGGWRVDADGRGNSRLRLELEGEDWGGGLESAGLTRALRGGEGSGALQLDWAGALYRPSLRRLQGEMELALNDGGLSDVEPGAGRLLGLVSLDLLPQRLRLDFRDLFTEGFAFGELDGRAQLGDGVLNVEGLTLEGASAEVRVGGRTDLVAREYDQQVVVVPRLRSALPIAGALLGGPVTGAAVLLVERVLGIGDHMEEAARVEYHVTGPWATPRVETRVEPADEEQE